MPAWSSWSALATGALDPAIGTNQDGRLEVFYGGTDGYLHHVWQNSPGGAWVGPAILPGQQIFGTPTVILDGSSQLQVYFEGQDCGLWRDVQAGPNGGWYPMENLGGVCIQPMPGVGVDLDGRIEAFAIGQSGSIWQRWQWSAGGVWSNWQRMPDPTNTRGDGSLLGGLTTPAVVRNSDGRLAVYSSGTPSAGCTGSWQCALTVLTEQTAPGSGWTPWTSLDTAGNALRSIITAAVNTNGIKEHDSVYSFTDYRQPADHHHNRTDYYP